MEVVILCGGKGTRLSEYTASIPKPMIQIGKKPILMHLMEFYASYGHKDFILCLGYKGDTIEEYFKDNKEFNIEFVHTGENANKAERFFAEFSTSIRKTSGIFILVPFMTRTTLSFLKNKVL